MPPGRTFSKQMRISLITALLGRFLKTWIRALSPLFFPCGSLGHDKLIMSLGFLIFKSWGRFLPPRQGYSLAKEYALTSSSSLSESQRLPSLRGSKIRLCQSLIPVVSFGDNGNHFPSLEERGNLWIGLWEQHEVYIISGVQC